MGQARPGVSENRLFTPAFIGLGLVELAYFTAQGLTIPLTPLFAQGPLGADEIGVGITVGSFSVTALLLRPFAGQLADRRGRRPLLIGGALLAAAAIAAHAVTADLALLIALRLVMGIAEAFFFVAGFAMVADLAPPGRAGEALSFNSLALYLGIAFGPIVGEAVLGIGGFGLAWVVAAGLTLAAGIGALAFDESAARTAVPGPMTLIHRAALAPSVGLFTGIAGMSGFLWFLALYVTDLGMAGTGPVLLLFGLVVVGTRIVFAKVPDRVPPFRLAAAALAMVAVGLGSVAVTASIPGLFLGTALTALGVAFTTPAFFAAIVQRVAPSERGVALGTTSLFIDLAFGGGPMLFGFVAAAFGIPVAFASGAVVATIGALGTAYAAVRHPGLSAKAGDPSGS
jgi:MFS family permease